MFNFRAPALQGFMCSELTPQNSVNLKRPKGPRHARLALARGAEVHTSAIVAGWPWPIFDDVPSRLSWIK